MTVSKYLRFSGVMGLVAPSASRYLVQSARTVSAAPLWYMTHSSHPFSVTSTVILFRREEKGNRRDPPALPKLAESRRALVSSAPPHLDRANRSKAASVLFPMSCGRLSLIVNSFSRSSSSSSEVGPVSSGMTTRAVEHVAMPCRMISRASSEMSGVHSGSVVSSWALFAKTPLTTVMRFSVKVPVLSEQMLVALPIVSQAARCRMRF
mmetsp:Transcript_27523/g.51159  ORF Transcript_27523/g.51159 Transcript_27523/m.51159 type:complete len:208 (-) Transcript_27523:240-863(-)